MDSRILQIDDNNIKSIRDKYPHGLHFVVGDTHGEFSTLIKLLEKIDFMPQADHVYFLGDYNYGGCTESLLRYMSQYYQEDYTIPGFHLIRGNHEREIFPQFELNNLPDVLVLKGKVLNYYLVHAGMVDSGFKLIQTDIETKPEETTFAYALSYKAACISGPLRQIVWSQEGLYSHSSLRPLWPEERSLSDAKVCIIHGHTPYSFLKRDNNFSYGERMLFWEKQKIWFSEDLHSFDIDSNLRGGGRLIGDSYRGLSCVCLEMIDEIAQAHGNALTIDGLRKAENFVFSVVYVPNALKQKDGDIHRILDAKPKMKLIDIDQQRQPRIY